MDILHITEIRADGGTQARASLDQPTVAEYKDTIERRENPNSFPFPAVVVFYDGHGYWLADGFHRLEAARLAGLQTVTADVRQGTRRDAVLYAVGANADHGLRRSDEDKRRAVLHLLQDEEWGRWADREIARRCNVSPTFVGKARSENGLTVHVDSERAYTTKQGTTAVMNTEKIGKGDTAVPVIYQPVWALQTKVGDWLRTEYGAETAAATAVLNELKDTGDKHSRWNDLVATLPTPHRKGDIIQAINNVVDIWRSRDAAKPKVPQAPTLAEIQALARQLRPGDKVRIVMGGWAGDVAEVTEARENPPVAWVQCLKHVTLPGGGIEKRMVSHQFPIAWMELVEASPHEEQEETANDLPAPRLTYETMSAYEWLRDYKDDHGRTWRDLSDSQVHHANSPCYQEFVKQFPNVSDHKFALKQCLAKLKRETAVPDMPSFDEIKAAIIQFVESQGVWPELAGQTFTAPLHHLRAETPTFFDQYATAIRDKYFDGFPIPDEVIQQAAAHIWGERSQAASRAMMAEAEAARAKEATPDTAVAATKPPRRCPRCQAENRAETVAADHWRCRNCGREYDHTGKIPANIPDPADDEPEPSRMAQSRLSIHASALGLSMDAYNEAVEGNVSLYTINSDNWDIVVLPHRPKAEHGLDILQLIINQLDRLIATTQPPEMHIYNRARINVDNALLELKKRNKK